jgi:hypothetical protein
MRAAVAGIEEDGLCATTVGAEFLNQEEGGLGSAEGVGALVLFVSAKIFGEGVLAYLETESPTS